MTGHDGVPAAGMAGGRRAKRKSRAFDCKCTAFSKNWCPEEDWADSAEKTMKTVGFATVIASVCITIVLQNP